ncbi:MAG: YlbF family regulator [Verrucomicrobia bacterium]|nr:YlbF family regulator [Verrucomicrobiota bacterium]
MEILTTETPVVSKTRELCKTIVEQPEFSGLVEAMDAFMASPDSQELYERVRLMQEHLQDRQYSEGELSDEEIKAFEDARDELLDDPVAKGFLEAQQQMHDVKATVTKYVTKTFEIGRVPEESDFASCACGGSCGCS